MPIRLGHRFWSTQAQMLRHARKAQILIKYDLKEFTFFDNVLLFWEWFERYKKDCSASKRPFAIYEILSTGKDMCFVCDIEVYCPLTISDSNFDKLQYNLRKEFRKVYGKYGDANNVIFMENHRKSSYRIKKSDLEKTPMHKLSLHALGLSEIFDEMHTSCEMKKLAALVNKDLMAVMSSTIDRSKVVLPSNSILDMKIYSKNRALRTIGSNKDAASGEFVLSECSNHMLLKNCFVTKSLCDTTKKYFRLPEEVKVAHEESAKHVLNRNTPVLHRQADVTPETIQTEVNIEKYLRKTFGDDVRVKYNGLYNNRNSYEVRGHRHCPQCKEEHISNCAYVNDRYGGNFTYNCTAFVSKEGDRYYKIDMNEFLGVHSTHDTPNYLCSFAHIRKKVISICAPMGTGKTFQIEQFLAQFPTGTRVLFLTCRKGMARSLSGRFKGYVVYTDKTNQDLQIVEFESLHRINTVYDVIVMDEIRSMLASAACFETNGLNLTTNMEKLQDLCEDAQHVICADADLHIDGCVKDFYDHMFEADDIHHINHISTGQKLHHKFATKSVFLQMLEQDLKEEKTVMVCCGSSTELQALRKTALKILPEEKIGIYFADSEKQHEIREVSKYWPNYKLIGFTSTVTVSVDYTDPIDRVYIYPSKDTCGQRDMNQMRGRARSIKEKLVVVMYDPNNDGPLIPLDVDLDALKNLEMNMVMNRRKVITLFRDAADREFYGTIYRRYAGHKARFFPTLLTHMWVWSRAEDYLKRTHWMRYFLTILKQKGYSWSCKVEIGADGEDLARYATEMEEEKSIVTTERFNLLEKVDVTDMGHEGYKVLMTRKIRGAATPEDLARIRKYQVQQHYVKPVDAAFVVEFNKKKRAIYNQTFINRFPQEVRRKIHSNIMIMKDSLDTVNADTRLIPGFQKTLKLMGFETAGSKTRIDFKNISEAASESMTDILEVTKVVKLERKSRGQSAFSHFNLYLEKIMGFKLKYHRIRKKGESSSAYSLENTIPTPYVENNLYSNNWFHDHCTSFDVHMNNKVGTELEFMGTFMDVKGVKRCRGDTQIVPNKRVKSFWGGL